MRPGIESGRYEASIGCPDRLLLGSCSSSSGSDSSSRRGRPSGLSPLQLRAGKTDGGWLYGPHQYSARYDGCDAWFSGRPLYQTQWVVVNRSAGDWLELGTGHQCSGQVVYRFAGYGYRGGWNPGWITQIQTGTEQIYVVVRETLTNWTCQVSGARVWDATWGVTATGVETGLEVYRAVTIMPPYTNRNLDYTLNNGPFTNWAGRDGGKVDSGMCGRWLADDQWRAGANTSCA